MRKTAMRATPYPYEFVEDVCAVIAQADEAGLDGHEIDFILSRVGAARRPGGFATYDGLCLVLFFAQLRDADRVTQFISGALALQRRARDSVRLETLRRQLSDVMGPHGLAIDERDRVTERMYVD